MMRPVVNWFRGSWLSYGYDGAGTAPLEAIAWRLFGVAVLAAFIAITFTTHPHPGLHGRDIAVLASFVAFVVFAIVAHPERRNLPPTKSGETPCWTGHMRSVLSPRLRTLYQE